MSVFTYGENTNNSHSEESFLCLFFLLALEYLNIVSWNSAYTVMFVLQLSLCLVRTRRLLVLEQQ